MKLTSQEITQNYYLGYQLALDIIKQKHPSMGSLTDSAEYIDLAQSVFGCERLVELIQTEKFDRTLYARVISEEVESVSKLFFPDVGKRRYVSIDKLQDAYGVELEEEAPDQPKTEEPFSKFEILDHLKTKLSPERFEYLSVLLNSQGASDREFIWNEKIFSMIDQSLEYLEAKIDQMRKLYPDGKPVIQDQIFVRQALTKEEIIGCYKNVYLGISQRFPVNFLNHDSLFRCAVLTQYAVENFLQKDPLNVLRENTCRDLSEIGLTGLVRYFNYSLNRLIRNAYPNLLMPWEHTHVENGFWSDALNRKIAIQWLIEEKLKIPKPEISQALREDKITKQTFAQNGLSYLFVQHYKSVSRCVGFAYPELAPWELGSVPNSFWQGEEGQRNIVRAVHWMIRRMNIPVTSIPEKIEDKTIARETFSRYGLSTVFERIYKKNMFQLFDAVFPGLFEMWEIGKVPSDYWENLLNAYRAALWVAQKAAVDEKDIGRALQNKIVTKETFAKHGLAGMLKKCFDNNVWYAFLPYLLPQKQDREMLVRDVLLLYILQKQVRHIRSDRFIVRLFQSLFYKPLLSFAQRSQLQFYNRIRKRIKKRIAELSRSVISN